MNSEKSYDSLPNFTAADCKYLIMLKNEAVFRVSLCMRALLPFIIVLLTWKT